MKVLSLLVAVCGLMATEVVGNYYQSPYLYAPAAPGYILPAYVPPYGAYHRAPVAGAYYGVPQAYEKPQDKYYYGGKYEGSCPKDGLYYKDDTTFVICSNGYASEQPCPPGTKTGGYPTYQGGYYYGYSDFCNVNLVAEYGNAPAPAYTEKAGYKEKSYGYEEKKEYNSYGKDSYSTPAYSAAPASYTTKNTYPRDAPSYDVKESYPTYPTANQYASSYTTKAAYQPEASTPYAARNSYPSGSNPYAPKETSAYPSGDSKSTYQAKDTTYSGSYQSKDTYSSRDKDVAYQPKNDYVKETYPAKATTAYPEKKY